MGGCPDTSRMGLDVLRHNCGFCSLREFCWPMDLETSDRARLQSMIRRVGSLLAGKYLFGLGDRFTAIYAVRSGCIKRYSIDAGGHELVYGFHLCGELLGFDAVYPDRHRYNALLLESSSVCVMPYRDIARLSVEFHSLHTQVMRLMSRSFPGNSCSAKGLVRHRESRCFY